jgi:GntR family transcriptional regulator/MocR family aminotransferase
MSHGRRNQLLRYAAARGAWIIEDDYDSEFRYGTRPLPALQGLDEHDRVVYLGTFSKTLFPSLRIAYLVLPPDLVEPFTRALNELFREGNTLQQRVLASLIAEGHYARHVRRMRRLYSARRALLIESLRRRFGSSLTVLGSDAGLHLTLALPDGVDDAALASETLARGVITRPLSLYSLRRPPPMRGLLLGYGSVASDELAPALEIVARVIEAPLRRRAARRREPEIGGSQSALAR